MLEIRPWSLVCYLNTALTTCQYNPQYTVWSNNWRKVTRCLSSYGKLKMYDTILKCISISTPFFWYCSKTDTFPKSWAIIYYPQLSDMYVHNVKPCLPSFWVSLRTIILHHCLFSRVYELLYLQMTQLSEFVKNLIYITNLWIFFIVNLDTPNILFQM